MKPSPPGKATQPRKPPKKQTSIRIDADIYAETAKLAEADKRSFSQYVELVLEQYLARVKHLEHQADERGHVPADMPTVADFINPGDVHGVWSAYNEHKAAEQMQALLDSVKR